MKKIFLIISLLLFCCVSVFSKNTVSPKDLYYDIERIQIDMSTSAMKEIYDPAPFEELKKEIMEGQIDRIECIYRIKKILSGYNIAHLNLQENYSSDTSKSILYCPFTFYCFGKEYRVLGTDEKYSKYLGWKLKAIGNFTAEEANNKIAEYMSYETPTGKKYALEKIFSYQDYLYMGLTSNKKIQFTFEADDGTVETVKCKPLKSAKIKGTFYTIPEATPFFCSHSTNQSYEIKPSPENKTIYIPYVRMIENVNFKYKDFFIELTKKLETGEFDTVVFDLRFNSGGQMILNSFLYDYKEILQNYNLALVISGRTYSAACEFIDTFLKFYPDVVIFGEETGESVFNYTSVNPANKLKKLGCVFIFPTIIDDVPQLYERSSDINRGTMPDVEVAENFEGYQKGEDSIYKAIYNYFNN